MLTKRLNALRKYSQTRSFKVFRRKVDFDCLRKFKKDGVPLEKRSAMVLKLLVEAEMPVILPEENIAFMRTVSNIPPFFDIEDINKYYHPKNGETYNTINNICIDWNILLQNGLLRRKLIAERGLKNCAQKQKDFLESVIICCDAIISLAKKYEQEARRIGNKTLAEVLANVPAKPAASFHEALQSVRLISAMFYLTSNYQLGFGRLDQYLLPYYDADIKNGKLTREMAKELLAEFFISLNRDSDLYFGVQQGDNGQSVMLGGVKADGTSAINDLTYLALEVSCELKLIDPKINLRIDSNTPQDLLELGCRLTREGLGFPQYSNDEIVIPALVNHGYSLEDARNYTVAACWEFIIPGKAIDIVNQGAVSFPAAVHHAFFSIPNEQLSCEKLKDSISQNIFNQVKNILTKRNIHYIPSPLVSIFMDNSLESKADITECAEYKNIGIHGAGIANGADQFVVIDELIRQNEKHTLSELKAAVENNWKDYDELHKRVVSDFPKTGNDDEKTNAAVKFLFDCFAYACETLSTKEKKVRAGTGTAQFYVWLTNSSFPWLIEPTIAAGEDGRKSGEPLGSSLSPAQGIKMNGILSVLKSFSHIDYSRVMNGGPITVEFDPVSLSTDESLKKLSSLIRYFVELGNQQIQLNVLNVQTLEDAVKHPERHRNLIVRVWGWSGYFCELAPPFQKQIINRHKYSV